MHFISKCLQFLGLADRSNNLSITNIAVLAVLIKVSCTSSISLVEGLALLVVFANYAHKRAEANKIASVILNQEVLARLAHLESQSENFEQIKSDIQVIKKDHEKVERQLEQTTKNLSTSTLASSFGGRR